MAIELAQRGIVYVPDFVINAGGVIHIHALRAGWGHDKLEGSLLAIGDRVAGFWAVRPHRRDASWRWPRRWRRTGWGAPSPCPC